MPVQFSFPKRRKVTKSGIERGGRREFPRHRKFVRSYACCVEGCDQGPIEFAHVRSAANSGTGIKPADFWGVSLCAHHHRESHSIGILSFEKKYKTNLSELAVKFALASPDIAMKEAMKNGHNGD